MFAFVYTQCGKLIALQFNSDNMGLTTANQCVPIFIYKCKQMFGRVSHTEHSRYILSLWSFQLFFKMFVLFGKMCIRDRLSTQDLLF